MNAPLRHTTMDGFVAAVLDFAINGRHDPKLAAASGVGEGIGSIGGFLVPGTVAGDVWSRVYSTGRIISRCTPQPVTRKAGISIPAISETSRADGSRFGGVVSYWVDEGLAGTPSKPKFDSIDQVLKKLLTIIYATDEMVEDVPALAAFLQRFMSLEMQFTIEDKIVNGTGSGTPLGVINSPALITVAGEVGQDPGTVLYANLAKMVARLWSSSLNNAVWLINTDVFNVLLQMTSATGAPIVNVDLAGVRRILTIPVEVCEYTPALSSAGDILLCDFSQYLLSQDLSNLESSIHVQYATDETAFKLRYRADGNPAWRTPVTPKNGTLTQSPFIALGPR